MHACISVQPVPALMSAAAAFSGAAALVAAQPFCRWVLVRNRMHARMIMIVWPRRTAPHGRSHECWHGRVASRRVDACRCLCATIQGV
eukprot:901012-Prymnesium_polylepis.1